MKRHSRHLAFRGARDSFILFIKMEVWGARDGFILFIKMGVWGARDGFIIFIKMGVWLYKALW